VNIRFLGRRTSKKKGPGSMKYERRLKEFEREDGGISELFGSYYSLFSEEG